MATRGTQARSRQRIFHGDRNVVQRPPHFPARERSVRFDRASLRSGLIERDDGIESGIVAHDMCEMRRENLGSRDFPLTNLGRQSVSWCEHHIVHGNLPLRRDAWPTSQYKQSIPFA